MAPLMAALALAARGTRKSRAARAGGAMRLRICATESGAGAGWAGGLAPALATAALRPSSSSGGASDGMAAAVLVTGIQAVRSEVRGAAAVPFKLDGPGRGASRELSL